jgi:hypothetical protein
MRRRVKNSNDRGRDRGSRRGLGEATSNGRGEGGRVLVCSEEELAGLGVEGGGAAGGEGEGDVGSSG